LLPPERVTTVRARRIVASETEVARADAVIFVVADGGWPRALKDLPFASIWTQLDRRRASTAEEPWLVSRLPTSRQTLAVVGRCRAGTTAFERLTFAAKLVRQVLQPGVTSLKVFVNGFAGPESADLHEAIASAALAATAPMPALKSTPPPETKLTRIELAIESLAGLERCVAIADGNHLARWLTTLPPNVLDSVSYRGALQELARREGWRFRFYDEKALRRLGAGAFLAVSRANAQPGAGIVRLSYRPTGARAPRIALVGKGICFDTGGINLKPHRSMYLMHGDMQGSAVAAGTLLALARQRAPVNIDCWLALTENEIGPTAYRPQEIVTALNGVTIQVVHSDAEGRMALADTLALACREQPLVVLDFATLTGACVNALTERYSGVFTNRDDWHGVLRDAGRASGERVWPFPMDPDFDLELESKVADVMQCTLDNKGDHILAARFLSRFVPAETPWVHVDLAASERKGGLAHVPTEFTGFGVRYATHLLSDPTFLARLE
jgi:leucyl aminopeptidase